MPRGGARANSGPRPNWNLGRTTTIRVPRILADMLLRIARSIDDNFSTESVIEDEEVKRNFENVSSNLLPKLLETIKQEFDQ
jgi:hypothetical protein